MKSKRGAGFSVLHLQQLWIVILILAGKLVIGAKQFNRHDFPPGFIFGAGTSAYQVEGAAFEDGRKPSIFDTYAHSAEQLSDNGDIACDQYHKYKEDVKLMVETGLEAYRFSISWPRLIPDGRGPVNPKGLEYYNNLINELISHGIEPHVTLVHDDLPQVLEDEYGGFLNRKIVEDFTAYADVCFREFGDRVKHWVTVNEANIFTVGGYDNGFSPPGRCSAPFGKLNCTEGNSTTEPYLVGHNIVLAHASVAKLYKEKYKTKQHGLLGFSLYAAHYVPLTNATEDVIAAKRSYDFIVGWLMHPLTYGEYPEELKRNAGNRIPSFTKNESELVKGSFDFIGINYYSVSKVKDNSSILHTEPRDFMADMGVLWLPYNLSAGGSGGIPSGALFPNAPWALQGVLEYFKEAYENPPIYILENGQITDYNTSVNDPGRVDYLQAHIGSVLDSVRNGSNVKGYFVWSFMDVYEFLFGYNYIFGLYYVDLSDPNLTRYPKLSQRWYSGFLKGENVTIIDEGDQAEKVPTNLGISPLLVDDDHLVS